MTHYAIQSEVDDISSKLKFISRIQPDQKISLTHGLSLVDKRSWYSKAWRTWDGVIHGEGRDASFDFIKEVIERAHNLLLNLRHSASDYDVMVYRKLVTELLNLEPGLRNLMQTYHRDVDYVTNIETMLDNLTVKITELCEYKGFDLESLRQESLNLRSLSSPDDVSSPSAENKEGPQTQTQTWADVAGKGALTSEPPLPPPLPKDLFEIKTDNGGPIGQSDPALPQIGAVNPRSTPRPPPPPAPKAKNGGGSAYDLPDDNPFQVLKSSFHNDLESGLMPPSRLVKRSKQQI